MAYQINKSDGTVLSVVADGQVDDQSTDITLIGKNYAGFGEALNENFVKLLENFSGTAAPESPIAGQIWFDASELKLKVYSGTAFVPVSSATISSFQPSTLGVGDLWFNDTAGQLYFFDGNNTILLGPDFSTAQGKSGLEVRSVLDTLNQTRVITLLYTADILIGIFSKDSFTPRNAIDGFSGDIQPGFNAGTLANIKFDVTATDSDSLGGSPASNYVRKDTSNQINGQISINSNLGLVIGNAGQGILSVKNLGDVFLANSATDRNLVFEVRRGITPENALSISSQNRTIDIYSGFSDSQTNIGGGLEVSGDVTIRGNLVINDGDITQIKASELLIEDKTIILGETGDSAASTDENASGGGIILRGSGDHVILWTDLPQSATASTPALASASWTSSEHFNLAAGKHFAIDGVPLLEKSGSTFRLTSNVTIADGIKIFGIQDEFTVDNLFLNNNRLSSLDSNGDIELSPDGNGNVVLVGSPKVTGMADPTDAQDASTKEYVDRTIQSRPILLSIDLSDAKPNSYIINNVLNNMAPPAEYRNGTIARILCNILNNNTTTLDINPLVNTSTATFVTPTGTAPAVTNVAVSQATVSGSSIQTTRIIKLFQINAGAWSFVSDTILPP